VAIVFVSTYINTFVDVKENETVIGEEERRHNRIVVVLLRVAGHVVACFSLELRKQRK